MISYSVHCLLPINVRAEPIQSYSCVRYVYHMRTRVCVCVCVPSWPVGITHIRVRYMTNQTKHQASVVHIGRTRACCIFMQQCARTGFDSRLMHFLYAAIIDAYPLTSPKMPSEFSSASLLCPVDFLSRRIKIADILLFCFGARIIRI